jgi:amidase
MKDIEISFEAMAASDSRDPWYVPAPINGPNFEKRVAFSTHPDGMPVCEEVVTAIRDSADRLAKLGWKVEEVECPPMKDVADINAQLWMAEMRHWAKEAIEKEAEPNSKFVFEQMTKRSPEIGIGGMLEALQKRATFLREWQLFLTKYPVLITPVSGQLPFPQQLDVKSENDFENVMKAQLTQLAVPALGLPALSVFTGFSGTTPLGVQLIGARFREDILIAAGTDIEKSGPSPLCVDPSW